MNKLIDACNKLIREGIATVNIREGIATVNIREDNL